MGRKRNNGLSEEKRNIIGQLIEMYDIHHLQTSINIVIFALSFYLFVVPLSSFFFLTPTFIIEPLNPAI